MAISSWPQGDTSPSWKFFLTLDSGTFDVSGLTGSNFLLILHDTNTNQEITGTGTFFGLQAATEDTLPFIFYTPNASDVATIGENRAYIIVNYGSGSKQTFFADYINIKGR